jgi:hypothetical protein
MGHRKGAGARWAAAWAVAASLIVARASEAQELPTIDGSASISSGVEGGGKGHAAGVGRARTTLRFGGEVGLGETLGPAIGAGLVLELEPRASVGADLSYVHLFSDRFALNIGGIAVLWPSTLYGATAGAELRFPIHRRISLTVGPSFQAFFAGDDLPDNNVIWQGLVHVGIHFHLR